MILILGFLGVLALGSILLMLPISHTPGIAVKPIDAVFTAASALFVTGLASVNIATHFSGFGQIVIAFLIQIGGLGFMSVAVVLFVLLGKKVGLRERVVLKESLGQNSISGIVRLLKKIIAMTLGIELVGAVLCFVIFIQDFAPLEAVKASLFHAVSSFNNCGLDVFDGGMMVYRSSAPMLLTTSALVILGGLGFAVICDVAKKRRFRTLTMHSKIVIVMTVLLLTVGTLLLKLTDGLDWLSAFFQSMTTRTAGFNSVDNGQLSAGGKFVSMLLMFIGASPGSTGGGIKTTSLFAMLLAARSLAKRRERTAFHRKIPAASVLKAFIITLFGAAIVCFCTLVLLLGEPTIALSDALYESVSAFATVGLSTGITPMLHDSSKIVLILTMFLGRLGPLTVACAWSFNNDSALNYVEEQITVG